VAFSLDTSGLLDAWVRHYPPDVFPAIWHFMDDAALRGEILVIDEVLREVERKDDGLVGWMKGHGNMVVPIDDALQRHVVEIMTKYSRLVDSRKNRSGCDPWVIALARERGLTVVTAEKASRTLAKPKIPDVCQDLGIPCIEIIDLFRRQGWKV
jgi:Domain of unknown function (DUF4411)